MARDFTLTDPGEGIHEAEIVEVHVKAGDQVEEGETLLTVETDKVTTEIPSPYSGTVEEVPVSVGDVAQVGDTLVRFDGTETDAGAAGEAEAEERDDRAAAVGELPEEPEEHDPAETQEKPAAVTHTTEARRAGEPVPASPATRRLARELGVDLREVEPGGPHGRVTSGDVRAASDGKAKTAQPEREPAAAREAPALPDFERWGPVERVRTSATRRTTGARMAESWREIAHVTHHDRVNITDLERFRRARAQDVADAGGRLTLTVLVLKALVGVLKHHARFNASLDTETGELVLKSHYHIGIAVDTEDGLLVPVVRDIDRKSVTELAVTLADLTKRAQSRAVDREDMQGATFTVTNVGPLGGTGFTPIIPYPQAAILGLARARLEPVVHGDLDDYETTVQLMLPLALSFDHRINDGADAARFVTRLIETLSDPESFLLAV